MPRQVTAAERRNSKRRKSAGSKSTTREPIPDEPLFEVKDILDEKFEKGRLLYKVDWADDPTTGEPYAPTWEPAENVTEAAVADWEAEKHRRQGVELQSSNPTTTESDSQPVLPPNWRAKRRRELSIAEGNERASTRHQGSVDSGYTSTDGDAEYSWALVQSVPDSGQRIVLDIVPRPGFDPSEYRYISSSQSAPSSQNTAADFFAASQGDFNHRVGDRISQRTVPDSQDYFDSLRTTQSTAKSQQASNTEGQISRSDLDIPSRQPASANHDSGRSSGLLETQRSAQGSLGDPLTHPSSSKLEPRQKIPSEDSAWAEGFLTQPDFEFPPLAEAETVPSQAGEALSSNQGLDQDRQEIQPHQSDSAPRRYSFVSASSSHPHLQAAQRVSLPISNPGLLTQVSLDSIVPETVQKPALGRPASYHSHSDNSLGNHEAANPSTPAHRRLDTSSMEGAGEGTPRPSALEMMRQIHSDLFRTSPVLPPPENRQEPPAVVSPSAVLPPMGGNFAEHLEASAAPADSSASVQEAHPLPAVEELTQGVGAGLDAAAENPLLGGHGMDFEQPPATVAPADLTTSVEFAEEPAHGSPDVEPGVEPDIEPDQFPLEMGTDDQDEDHAQRFTVTLPMAANARPKYLATIAENKPTMFEYGQYFADAQSSAPGPSLVAKIDGIFERLLSFCDLPAYDDDFPELNKGDMMKHATNTNSKFSFVFEFLNSLWDINSRVLILSQPGRVFEYLEAVVSAMDCPYTILTQDGLTEQPSTEGISVILSVAGQDLSQIQGGVEVVIAFDHAARSVELPATLGYESMAPLVLYLVATYSLDHIDQQLLQVEQDLDSLERRNALSLATGAAKVYLMSPERQYTEPHETAKTFANFLRNPDMGLDWDPHPLPSDIFEIWLSSQERTQETQAQATQAEASNGQGGRKRPADIDDEGTPKRARLLDSRQPSRNATPARMSDLLRQTLVNHAVEPKPTAQVVEVPVEQLERMSGKIAELEARLAAQSAVEAKTREHCTSLESQLRSWERTVQSLQPKYMDALQDRSTFEKQCKKAVEKENAATECFEAQKTEIAALKEKNRLLETKLAEAKDTLAKSTVPDIAKVAQAEKERQEALAVVEKLEKKVVMVQNEVEYSRKAYQDASNAHTELNQENQELRTKIADLERRASDNLRQIHQIHAQNELSEVNRHIDDLRAMLDNRERELDRAKEELKYLKNGRRETRQGSVPRSPRTGVMSPRPARGMGGPGSRGTSPAPLMSSDGPGVGGGGGGGTSVPGMTLFPPVTNAGRWGHLRD